MSSSRFCDTNGHRIFFMGVYSCPYLVLLDRAKNFRDGSRQPQPPINFCLRRGASFTRQPVELHLAVVFRKAPLGFDEALVFDTVERGIQGAFFDSHMRWLVVGGWWFVVVVPVI